SIPVPAVIPHFGSVHTLNYVGLEDNKIATDPPDALANYSPARRLHDSARSLMFHSADFLIHVKVLNFLQSELNQHANLIFDYWAANVPDDDHIIPPGPVESGPC